MSNSRTKDYLFHLHEQLITNQIINCLLILIEILPIINHVIKSSFIISRSTLPKIVDDILSNASIYDLVFEHFNDNYPFYLYIISIAILGYLILYKYFFLSFFFSKSNKINFITINFYELIVLKLLGIFILEIGVSKIFCNSMIQLSLCTLYTVLFIIGFFMHQSTNYFFIDITSNKVPVLCSKFYQTQNNYLFLAKIILTLINNATEVITNTHFLDWLLIVFVILSLLVWFKILNCSKFSTYKIPSFGILNFKFTNFDFTEFNLKLDNNIISLPLQKKYTTRYTFCQCRLYQ